MKQLRLAVACMLSLVAAVAFSQSYPTQNPTYFPTAVLTPPTTISAPGTVLFRSSNIASGTVRISGTCTSLAAVVQGTNDNSAAPTWVTIPGIPIAGGSITSALSTTGFWRYDFSGFTQTRVNVTALSASCTFSVAGTTAVSGAFQPPLVGDPCQNNYVLKKSIALNQGASATTQVIALVASQTIYVCSLEASLAGTTPTVTVVAGTGANCGTGQVLLTGAMVGGSPGFITLNGSGVTMQTPSANALCLTTAATTSIQGVLTYVQQ